MKSRRKCLTIKILIRCHINPLNKNKGYKKKHLIKKDLLEIKKTADVKNSTGELKDKTEEVFEKVEP